MSFEDFDDRSERVDDVQWVANHHTYDGNTHHGFEEYFDRCHAALRPGGRLIFESHPPAVEGRDFSGTVDIIGPALRSSSPRSTKMGRSSTTTEGSSSLPVATDLNGP